MRRRTTSSSRVSVSLVSLALLTSGLCNAATQDTFLTSERLIQRHDYSEAIRNLDGLLSCGDLTDAQKFQAGWFYGQAHEFVKALHLFEAVPENIPDRVTHHYALALVQTETNDFAGAVASLEPLLDDPGFLSKQLNLLGVAYSKTTQPAKAAAAFERAIRIDPADPAGYFNLTTLLCEHGALRECLDAARHTASVFPKLSEAQLIFGAALVENGRLADSRPAFLAARELDPNAAEPVFFLALADYQAHDYAAAIQSLRASMTSGLRDADLSYLLAASLVQQGNGSSPEVAAELDRALTLNPHSAAALALRGKLNVQRHEYVAAISDLESALKQDPQSQTALYLLARAYQALGRSDEAQALRKRMTLSSDDGVAKLAADRSISVLAGLGSSQR